MDILETISMWGGVAGVVIALFAIIILYLTRSNIIELLDKDAIMYDAVFELKQKAFEHAFEVLDLYEMYGMNIRSTKQFIQKAKTACNDLMCTANSPKVYQEFYRLTLDPNHAQVTVQEVANFKVLCRLDLGLKDRKIKNQKVDTSPVISQIKATEANHQSKPALPVGTPKAVVSRSVAKPGANQQPAQPVDSDQTDGSIK